MGGADLRGCERSMVEEGGGGTPPHAMYGVRALIFLLALASTSAREICVRGGREGVWRRVPPWALVDLT